MYLEIAHIIMFMMHPSNYAGNSYLDMRPTTCIVILDPKINDWLGYEGGLSSLEV
jgi:hypothetical protein